MDIWIGRNGERHGPYKEADVRQWLRSGEASGEDLGWYDGLADWQPLSVLFPEEMSQPTAAASPPSMSAAPLPPTTMVTLENYAGFWKRLLAYIVDSLALYIPSKLIAGAMGAGAAEARLNEAVQAAGTNFTVALEAYRHYFAEVSTANLLVTLMAWLYFAFCESSSWQGTLGKLAVGIRVTDLHGTRISLPRALGRYPAKFLSVLTLGFGFLMAGWTSRKQALHDMLASTLVLNGRASEFRNAGSTSKGNESTRFDA